MPTLNDLAAVVHPPGTLLAATSLFASATATTVERVCPLREVLAGIQGGQWAAEVAQVRQAVADGNKERTEYLKKRLPAFTVSAVLRTRARDAGDRVITHTGWLQADFDAKNNPGMVQTEARAALMADPHAGAVFVGPSGSGIKALVRIDGDVHAAAVDAAIAYFQKTHGLVMDTACRDIERLCFISHDPEAWLREDAATVLAMAAAPVAGKSKKRVEAKPEDPLPLLEWTMTDVHEVLGWLPKERPDYDTWLRVVSGVSSVLPMAEAIKCLQEWMPPEKPGEYEAKWRHRLQHVTIRTVIHMAQARGFDAAAAARRQRWMGRMIIGGKQFGSTRADNSDLLAVDVEPEGPGLWDTWKHLKDQQRGDAAIFAAKLGHSWKYDVLAKRWRHYNEATGLWERDAAGTVTLVAGDCAMESYLGLIETIDGEKEAKKAIGSDSDRRKETKQLDSEIKELNARCANLGRSGWCAGMMSFAEKMPAMLCKATDYDQSRHLLAVQNGVLNFQGNQFLEFDRGHRLASAAPVEFVPGAKCPAFDSFLETCMDGDADLIAYLWRIVGYSLTGFVDHDALFFCYGTGANGKSTFFLVMRMLLGDALSTMIDIATLLGGSSDSGGTLDYKKSMLEGKRLVLTDEIPDDRKFNESMVKQLLGGEDIVARRPYEMPYTFAPTHKIWAVGNHKPHIKGTDHGIWRRMHLIPWLVTIPPERRRPRHEMLSGFRKELPGILNAALAGYGDFLDRGGIAAPAAVLAATEEYRQEEDSLGSYLSEKTAPAPMASVRLVTMLKDYLDWCEDSGEYPTAKSAKKLASMLKDRGARIDKFGSGGVAHVVGMALTTPLRPEAANGQTQMPF